MAIPQVIDQLCAVVFDSGMVSSIKPVEVVMISLICVCSSDIMCVGTVVTAAVIASDSIVVVADIIVLSGTIVPVSDIMPLSDAIELPFDVDEATMPQ